LPQAKSDFSIRLRKNGVDLRQHALFRGTVPAPGAKPRLILA
jgi:hypothetical protein